MAWVHVWASRLCTRRICGSHKVERWVRCDAKYAQKLHYGTEMCIWSKLWVRHKYFTGKCVLKFFDGVFSAIDNKTRSLQGSRKTSRGHDILRQKKLLGFKFWMHNPKAIQNRYSLKFCSVLVYHALFEHFRFIYWRWIRFVLLKSTVIKFS